MSKNVNNDVSKDPPAWMASHGDSFSHRGHRELGHGLKEPHMRLLA